MNLNRRAPRPTPLPESRRSSDFFRPVTTSAYSAPIPLVIGQQRIPTTVIRDGRRVGPTTLDAVDNLIRYGLAEGPIVSIGKMYADKGMDVNLGSTAGANAHFTGTLPWVGITAPSAATATPDSRSFEVSSDLTLAGADGSYVTWAQDLGEVANGLPKIATETGACMTGSGDTAKTFAVLWSAQNNSLTLWGRTGSGAWSQLSILCSASVNAAYLPASGAAVQPCVAAVGTLVHVVWSRLDQAAEPVQIVHAWSTNGGSSWSFGQSLVPQTKAGSAGVQRLQLALHSSGEVWVSCQKRNQVVSPNPYANNPSGAVVGFLPSTATTSTAWILPDTSVRASYGGNGWKGELCLLDTNVDLPFGILNSNLLRAPSVMPLGSGKAMLSAIFSPSGNVQQNQLYVLPIKADTLVRWDLAAAAFNLKSGDTEPHSNVASLPWVNANGYNGKALGWVPNGNNDYRNEGSTQLVGLDSTSFAVLTQHAPMFCPSFYRDFVNPSGSDAAMVPSNHPDRMGWGAWKVYWGSIGASYVAWFTSSNDLNTSTTNPAYRPSLFWNGNGQLFASMGRPATTRGSTAGGYWECWSAPCLEMWKLDRNQVQTPWLTYWPATALQNSVGYQFVTLNGEALAIWREDEEGDANAECGLRHIVKTNGTGDVLPSVICKRLLAGDPIRGLNIQWLSFDTETWAIFDNYCAAMGLRFSLALTSQQAAWPLVCDILESANAVPFRSQGKLKVYVRETASITGNGVTYTPKAEHGASCMTIPAAHLREEIRIEPVGSDSQWNRLTVSWKNRARNYSDQTTVIQDEGAVSRKGVIDAAACDWPWIVSEQTALTCAWLRLRHQMRTGRTYSFAVDQRYMLLEPGDIVTVGDGQIPPRTVRIQRISEGVGDWREIEAEDVVVSTSSIAPPGATGGSAEATVSIAAAVNLPIIFVALIGGLLQVWCLLSAGAGWRGCTVQQSWDGATWETIGTCQKQSPTGHLIEAMDRLRVRPGQRVHPGLRLGMADFAVADFSESASLPPWPMWSDYLAGNPGALLWVDGELLSYATESDDGQALAQCSVLQRGLYGTARGSHPILARVGAVTDNAFRWPVPPGSAGRTCYLRFPVPGETPSSVVTYSVGIPA